jgi:hypothetical protein
MENNKLGTRKQNVMKQVLEKLHGIENGGLLYYKWKATSLTTIILNKVKEIKLSITIYCLVFLAYLGIIKK